MKYIRQFLIILIVSCIGELLNHLIPLPIPASIYGLVIMLGLLFFKLLPLSEIEETAEFLVSIMPIMFISPAVGLITYWAKLKEMLLPFVVICVSSTFLVILSTGKIADYFIQKKGGEQDE